MNYVGITLELLQINSRERVKLKVLECGFNKEHDKYIGYIW